MTTEVAAKRDGFFEEARREFDDAFRRLFGMAEVGKTFGWSPRVDVSESDKAVVVKVDLPGVESKDIDISVRDGILTVKGEKKEEREEKQKNFHRMERFNGQFFRAIPLPAGVDEDGISATTTNGVITVTAPKKPGIQPKKIAVKPQ